MQQQTKFLETVVAAMAEVPVQLRTERLLYPEARWQVSEFSSRSVRLFTGNTSA